MGSGYSLDLRERVARHVADGAPEGVEGAGADTAQMGLELGEGHLDRVEVGRVGRQEQEPGAYGAEDLGGPGAAVHREVIEDDDVALAELRRELGFDPDVEGGAVHRPVEQPGRHQPIVAQAGDEGLRPLVAQRRVVAHPRAPPRPPAQPRHVGPGAAFVDEDQPVRLLAHPRLPPAGPFGARRAHVGALPLAGDQRLFLYVMSARISAREIEEGCAFTPCSASSARASSGIVMSGTASTSSTRKST